MKPTSEVHHMDVRRYIASLKSPIASCVAKHFGMTYAELKSMLGHRVPENLIWDDIDDFLKKNRESGGGHETLEELKDFLLRHQNNLLYLDNLPQILEYLRDYPGFETVSEKSLNHLVKTIGQKYPDVQMAFLKRFQITKG